MENTDRVRKIYELYDQTRFKSYFTEDCETITSIDCENNTIHYYFSYVEECGCCSNIEEKESDLDWFITYMSDSDFEGLITELKLN